MKKILIFQLKNVCYNSYTYFESKIGEGLKYAGYDVTYFQVGRDGVLSDIEQFIGQDFDLMLEFNSDLPKIFMEDGSHFLSQMNAPFIDFILDHPLYHHDMLKQPLDNFYVCCMDDNHRRYILEHYPHIRQVLTLPMTGEEYTPGIPFCKRMLPLLFSGTYTSTSDVWNAIETCPPFISRDIKQLIEIMLADASLPMEAAVKELASHTDSLIEANFALHMQAYFLVDTYLRSYLREKMVTALIDQHFPLALYGGNWEQMPCKNSASLTIHAGIPYDRSFELMANAKIVLNVMPLFKAGSHDRVVASMLNHSVSLTDTSLYLEEHFTNKKDIVLYSIDNVDSLLQAADQLLHDDTLAEEIAENGYQTASRYHTWKNRMDDLLPFIHSILIS